MDEQLSHGNPQSSPDHLQRVKDRLSTFVTEAPKAITAAKDRLPLDVAERTARSIWSKIKRDRQEQTPPTEDERPLSKWELAARELQTPPLPNLHTTEQMLRSASALVRTEAQHAKTNISLLLHELGFARRQQKAVEKIIAGNQQALEAGNVREVRNPSTEGFEAYLSGNEEPLPFSTNHAEVIKDDPNKNNDVDRTAALICAVVQIREDVRSESWAVETSRSKPLDMRGYKRAFSKREAGEKGDTLTSVLDSDHVTVIVDGVLFKLNLSHPDGQALTPDEIRANVAAMKNAVDIPPEIGPGLITTMNRRDLSDTRKAIKADSAGAAVLDDLDKSLWTFIIDTEAHPETLEQTAALMQYGTYNTGSQELPDTPEDARLFSLMDLKGYNDKGYSHYVSPGAWFDGHSIRVAANGKAGGNFEHLAMDGSESMWMLNKLAIAAERVSFSDDATEVPATAFEPLDLPVPAIRLKQAKDTYVAEIEKQSIGVVEVDMEFDALHYFDSTIQLALAAAMYEVNDKRPSFAIEPMNLRHQMGGRLGYGLLNLHAMQKYVEWMSDHADNYDKEVSSLDDEGRAFWRTAKHMNHEARSSHMGMLAEVKDGNSPLNHLTTLTGIFKDELSEKAAYVRDVEGFFTALDKGTYHMIRGHVMTNGGSRENIEAFMTISSMSADGVGIGYSKKDNPGGKGKIVFTIRAKGKSQQFIDRLRVAIPKHLKNVIRDQI